MSQGQPRSQRSAPPNAAPGSGNRGYGSGRAAQPHGNGRGNYNSRNQQGGAGGAGGAGGTGPRSTPLSSAKLCLLGTTAVGKSSIALRFARDQFMEYQESTIGAAFLTQTVTVEGVTTKFEIWDTAGQERYHSLAPMYYRGAKAAIVVYDVTSKDSFERAKNWVDELAQSGSDGVIVAFVGNKSDLEDEREVSREEAEAYARDSGLIFFETSAKDGINIIELFSSIARRLPRPEPSPNQAGMNSQQGVQLRESGAAVQDACSC